MHKFVAFGCLVLLGCSEPHDSSGLQRQQAVPTTSAVASLPSVPTLSLRLGTSEPEQVELVLEYSGSAVQGPRVAEFHVEHSENLVFSSSEAGAAAAAAGKEVAVQAKDSRHTRVVVYSASSTATIGSGVIVKLRFARTGGETATAKILTDRPLFAPKEAQAGLQVSEPLSI
jgi:hypothetical protein